MAIALVNVRIELREILLKDRPKELYKLSSKGTVPVMHFNDGKIIDESLDIMLWANDYGNLSLLIDEIFQMKLIRKNDDEFKYWLDRYKYFDRYLENSYSYYQQKCSIYLKKYEFFLKTSKYFVSNKMQLVDIAIFPFIRQCANVDRVWFEDNYKKLNYWLIELEKSSLFQSVMTKYRQWNKNDEPILISYPINGT